jgi:hypothetical protein
MKSVTTVLRDGVRLQLTCTPEWSYALEKGVRNGEGVLKGVDSAGENVTVACRHVMAYSVDDVEPAEEKTDNEEDGCNS